MMHMGMGGGGRVGYGLMRSMRQDEKVKNHKLPKGIVRRVLGFAKPYTAALLLFLVLIVIDALVGAVNPLFTRAIINELVGDKNSTVIVELALAMAGLYIFDAGLGLWERWISSRVGEGLIFDMRNKVFNHIQRMPIAFFTRTQTGALISRLNNDVLGAQQAFTDTFNSVIGNLVTVGVTLVAMFILSWQITALALLMLPVFIFPARWVGKRLAGLTREAYNLNADMNAMMSERFNVAGALLVKIFGRPEYEADVFRQRTGRVRDIGVTTSMYGRIFFTGLMLTASLATALVYGFGGVLVTQGALSVGTLVAMTQYLARLYGPLTSLSNVQVDVLTALVSFDRVFEVLDLPPMIDDKPDASTVERGPTEIAFDHVNFSYPRPEEVSLASLEAVAVLERSGGQQVLFDVSFVAQPGQLVALVGPSGAGKTTISHLSARLYDVSSGAVKVNGVDVKDVTLSSLQEAIGVVTQEAHLFHDTLRANLLYARPEASEDELVDALRDAQILDMVMALPDGLDTLVGDRGYRLSGGEKQRVAIARLLLKAPDFVVLDEATAHLDSESEVAVQRALKKVLAGRTSIVIAHRLSTVREADQILVIDGGRVVERGRHAELLANDGLYADLYHTQFADQIEVADETDGDIEELGGEGFLVRFNRDDLGPGEVPALS
ncbi:MAG TPA: ABC transporter ATP-binding protein [Acidimicrobiales bacterium]|nr:ABC transporter ATP-binding protein [Acidimicrobiales bacterium]